MAVKLFTIGDSISQGFMSGAAAKTNQCYSTILASILEAENYHFPSWEKGGIPIDLETVFRKLEDKLDTDIKGPIEWVRATSIISKYLDDVEDYYERGDGALHKSIESNPFHNVAIRGFDISNSWQLTPNLCKQIIDESEDNNDDRFGLVNESFHRTAFKVLASGNQQNFTQLDWLEHHHKNEGVENLVLWLGANNALGTVLDLKIRQTSIDGTAFPLGPDKVSYRERLSKEWNLWHPEDFRKEYSFMLDKVIDIMTENPNKTDYKVFIATVPLVTICPLIKAVDKYERTDKCVENWPVNESNPAPMGIEELPPVLNNPVSYAKYYPYFLFEDNFDMTLNHLNQNEVVHIDNCIRRYNRIIQELVALANERIGEKRFYLVDIATSLSKIALKRNNYNPKYVYPEYFRFCYPRIDSKYYGVNRNKEIKSGGLFSLDGVHPTAIGQGIIAYEFLKVMSKAGVYSGDIEKAIDWADIFRNDTLYSKPIGLLGEIYDNPNLKKWLFKIFSKTWEHKKY